MADCLRVRAACGMIAAILCAMPGALSFHGPDLPVQHATWAQGAGWTELLVEHASGPVTFETLADAASPHVQRVHVRDATGAATLSFETLAHAPADGVEARALETSRRASVGASASAVTTFFAAPACATTSQIVLGPDAWRSSSTTVEAACLGPQPWTVLVYAVGADVRSRGLQIRSAQAPMASGHEAGEGGLFVALADEEGATALQAQAAQGALSAGALDGSARYAPRGRFVGSFAAFADDGGAFASHGATAMACPCSFDGLPEGEWTFSMRGSAEDVRTVYLAGVDIAPR